MYVVRTPFSMRFFEAAENMRATLDAGITTVREAGGSDLGIKTAQQRGMIAGPRMQISISMLSQTGGHGDDWQVRAPTCRRSSSPIPAARTRSSTVPTRCAARCASDPCAPAPT